MSACDTPGLMPIKHALDAMLNEVNATVDPESIPIIEACDRILAIDVLSPIDVPPADNSAMDGYAVATSDFVTKKALKLVGTSLAGSPYNSRLQAGQCVRIMTGAVIPAGADAVVMQEQTTVDKDKVTFLNVVSAGNNVRRAGEDIKKDSQVLVAGTKLQPAHLSLLASIGVAEISVFRPVRVALMATGDELTPPGQPLNAGAIYESNRYALYAMLVKLGCQVMDLGIVTDDKTALRTAFDQASRHNDLILTSGGVSVGDADFVKDVLTETGQVGFWKVAIKPGKPFAFGRVGQTLFCGLPGNPVSSFVTFQQLVIPLIRAISGQSPTLPFVLKAKTTAAIRKRPGRADFQRGLYQFSEHGELLVEAHGRQGSGVMSSISSANCYILLKQNDGDIESGTEVDIQPFVSIMQ